jgi:UPF0716 protein FxsA
VKRLILLAAFIAVPLAEIYLIIQVGQVIGAWWTVALLIAISILGSWLVRREGRRTWRALTEALAGGRIPNREVLDAAMVLVGGALMLTPGFLTDVVGLFVMLPATRPVARRVLVWALGRQLNRQMQHRWGAAGMPGAVHQPRGPVVEGEVIDPR